MEHYELPDRVSVLLIEDDEDDYILTRQMLADMPGTDFELDWCSSAEAGRQALGRNEHDVCLLDYRLGGEDGMSLLAEASDLGFKGPLIMLTGQGDRETDIQATELGAADYLVKGEFDEATLERTLRYALSQKAMERERLRHLRNERALAEAESANRAKDEFLAMVAHELRSPLQTISLWADALQEQDTPDPALVRKASAAIGSSTRRLAFLVEDLLDISRMVNGQLKVEPVPTDIQELVSDTITAMTPRAQEAGLELELRPLGEPCELVVDPRRLQQVVENLVSNAIKFTPEGGTITVSLDCDDKELRMEVTDTGEGMEPELVSKVFDRYQQGEHAKGGDRRGGLGLGLAIVKHVVELHKGTVSAHSEGPGQGSTFTVVLPLN